VKEPNVSDPGCLFCRIVSGEIPARFVHRDEQVVAFHDVNPQAPVHVLVVPVRHIESVRAMTSADAPLLGAIVDVVNRVAADTGIAESGFRTVANTGADGGQSVDHLHFHVLGGRRMSWPPG
jgi:histidine triad (HIT) family protein